MKKLNLQLGSIKEMLTKEQMKKVAGGYGCYTGNCMDVTVDCICTDQSSFQCTFNSCDCDGLLQCDIAAGDSCFCN